jgi:hypothetical protein
MPGHVHADLKPKIVQKPLELLTGKQTLMIGVEELLARSYPTAS